MTRVHNALDATFSEARGAHRGVLMPYLTAGYPDMDGWVDLAAALLDAGGNVLEIGIPFSDPLLDGPTIQRAQQSALDAGITPADCLDLARAIHRRCPQPLLFMGAYNPLLAFGLEAYCCAAAEAGITGLIVPDLPFDEQDELRAAANASNLHLIQLVAPTSSDERLQSVCATASGFVYCISVAGLTGVRTGVAELARPLVNRVQRYTDVPTAVGFGIATPESVAAVTSFADAAIVASALVDLLDKTPPRERLAAAQSFITTLSQAVAGRAPDDPTA